jgi:hypothetical protein
MNGVRFLALLSQTCCINIFSDDSHDGTGMYLVPLTKGITMDEVCSGTVSEVHLLVDKPSPAMQPAISGELEVK